MGLELQCSLQVNTARLSNNSSYSSSHYATSEAKIQAQTEINASTLGPGEPQAMCT